jgi:oligopeptide/dipeptide ABC transporter ATP-binding protein
VNLLSDLQSQMGLTCLFIAHDISVVRHISDTMAVMYLGRVVEFGSAAQICEQPRHPYTSLLLSSVPKMDRRRVGIRNVASEPPSPVNVPSGCRFHTRCPFVMPICVDEEPPPIAFEDGSWVACHLHGRGARPEGIAGSRLSSN